jgi:inward rectifier potassium channel
MAVSSQKLREIQTTGFGTQARQVGKRLYGKNGIPNVEKRGISFFDRLSWYHTMLDMPRWEFWLWLSVSYLVLNLVFATIYFEMDIHNLAGVVHGSKFVEFAEAFFFSAQTFTTVGYGRLSPTGMGVSAVAAFESFLGLLALALASGLFYGRFSRPRAFLKFSELALISPYKDGIALMFRVVPYKKHHLIEAEVKLTARLMFDDNGKEVNKFYDLDVEFNKINALITNWTIVHPLNEDSPLSALSMNDFKKFNVEILVHLKAYDEGFANTVISRTSYTPEEIIEGAKFIPMYRSSDQGTMTILEMDKLNRYDKVSLPVTLPVSV